MTDTMPVAVQTDVGGAYLKPLWNAHSGQWLAREWIGLKLAAALGLAAPPCVIYDVSGMELVQDRDWNDCLEGPALLIQEIDWTPWDGKADELKLLNNPQDVAGLVLLDTWLRNTDRYPGRCAGQSPPNPRLAHTANVAFSRSAGTIRTGDASRG